MNIWSARYCHGRLLLFALALASDISSAQAQYFEKSPEEMLREKVEEAREGWKHRAAKIKTARIKWTLTRTDMAGSLNGVRTMNLHGAGMLPAVDTTTKMDFELLYKDGFVRLEQRGQTWHAGSEQPIDAHHAYAYGLDKVKYFTTSSGPGVHPYAGIVSPADEVSYLSSLDCLPLGILLSPLDARISSWTDCGPIERIASKDDAEGRCYEVAQQGLPSPQGSRFWVSEAKPGKLLKFELRRKDDSIRLAADVGWTDAEGIGAIPAFWTLVSLDVDGRVERVKENVITEIALNVPLTDGDLDIGFPPGTPVFDLLKDARFIVNDAGELLPLSPNAALPHFGMPWAVFASLIAIVALLAFRRRIL